MKVFFGWLLVVLILTGCAPRIQAGQFLDEAVIASPTPAALLARYTTVQPSPTQPQATPAATFTPARPTPQAVRTEPPVVETPERKLPTSTPTASPLDGFQICSPLADVLLEDLPRLISDGYHPPASYHSDARHPGIDIAFYNWKGRRQIAGVPVQSVLPGRVAVAEMDTFPFGNVVVVETQSQQLPSELKGKLDIPDEMSVYLLYAHMQEDSMRVTLGQTVTACQTLGQVGKTGNAGQAHLHLENRTGPPGTQLTGFQYYTEKASQQEKVNYKRWATEGVFKHFDPLRLLLYEFGYEPTPVIKGYD